jgi:peptidoglycan/xylan/chitin deacetylase (PgdA/CDA1 family)
VTGSLAGSLELTFDDGPDPVWTPAILAALRGSPLHATFFVVAARACEHPGLIAAMRADGHAVELRCYSHRPCSPADRAAVEHDTELGLAVLGEAGVRPRRWRPPGGFAAPWMPEIADAHGLELCGWDIDSNDRRGDRAETMLALAGPSLRPGAVVLLHDGIGPGDRRSGCEETVRFARLLAAEAAEAAETYSYS